MSCVLMGDGRGGAGMRPTDALPSPHFGDFDGVPSRAVESVDLPSDAVVIRFRPTSLESVVAAAKKEHRRLYDPTHPEVTYFQLWGRRRARLSPVRRKRMS